MSTHNIGFYEDLTKIIFELSSNMHHISSAVSTRFDLGCDIPKSLQRVLATPRLFWIFRVCLDWLPKCPYNVTWMVIT